MIDAFNARESIRTDLYPIFPRFPGYKARCVFAEALQPPSLPENIASQRTWMVENARDPATDKVSRNYDDLARRLRSGLSTADWFASMLATWTFDAHLTLTCGVPFLVEHNEIVSARNYGLSAHALRESHHHALRESHDLTGYLRERMNTPLHSRPEGIGDQSWRSQLPYGSWHEFYESENGTKVRDKFVRGYIEIIEMSLRCLADHQQQYLRQNMGRVFELLEPVWEKRHQKSWDYTLDRDTYVLCCLQKEWFSEVQDFYTYGLAPASTPTVKDRVSTIVAARMMIETGRKQADFSVSEINEWLYRNSSNNILALLADGLIEEAMFARSLAAKCRMEASVTCTTKSIRLGQNNDSEIPWIANT